MASVKNRPAPSVNGTVEPQTANGPATMSVVQQKFMTTRRELADVLIERDEEIDCVLTSMIACENPLLVGPPGTGKSLLLDSIMAWMNGSKFSWLLGKYSTPDEVYGPIDIQGLKVGQYRRVTAGKLPEATGAFLDEIFKASTAILNTLLRILNERVYEDGAGFRKVPLRICVAASNEFPAGEELSALFDRFLIRKIVRPIVARSARHRLWWDRNHKPTLSTTITPAEVDQANREATALPWTDAAKDAFEKIIAECVQQGVQPGDRRQYKAVGACQAFAYLNGATEVQPEHLEILQHILWDNPTEGASKVAQIVIKIANPTGALVNECLLAAEQIMSQTDATDPASAVRASKALTDLGGKLSTLKGNARVDKCPGLPLGAGEVDPPQVPQWP